MISGGCSTPSIAWAICTMARTGSTWLSQLVASTGQLGYPEEYLLDWQGWCTHLGLSRDLRREDYLAYLAQLRVTPNGVFGIKGSCDELTPFFELFPCPPCVWLTRENKVEQAVSWHRAHDLGAWTHLSRSAAGSDPIWAAQRALWFFDEIHRREVKWREIFVSRQIDPLVLTYEAVCRDPLAAVRAIALHVGWDPRSIERVSSPLLVVRSDASREVCQRLEDLLRVRGA
jgi:trehalose 2-sulfotransferase